MRLILLFLLLLPFCAVADDTEDQLKSFLNSREVISRVYFSTASKTLARDAEEKLDKIVPTLRMLSSKGYLLRVEGFASPEGTSKKNVNLSMYRAMAVRNYLRDKHELELNLFLTGFGAAAEARKAPDARRVDLAVYHQPSAAKALFDDQGTAEKIVVK